MVGVLDVIGRRDLYDDVQKRGCLGILSLGGLFLGGILVVRHQRRDYPDNERSSSKVLYRGSPFPYTTPDDRLVFPILQKILSACVVCSKSVLVGISFITYILRLILLTGM